MRIISTLLLFIGIINSVVMFHTAILNPNPEIYDITTTINTHMGALLTGLVIAKLFWNDNPHEGKF